MLTNHLLEAYSDTRMLPFFFTNEFFGSLSFWTLFGLGSVKGKSFLLFTFIDGQMSQHGTTRHGTTRHDVMPCCVGTACLFSGPSST